jgi:hypothetical protein
LSYRSGDYSNLVTLAGSLSSHVPKVSKDDKIYKVMSKVEQHNFETFNKAFDALFAEDY